MRSANELVSEYSLWVTNNVLHRWEGLEQWDGSHFGGV